MSWNRLRLRGGAEAASEHLLARAVVDAAGAAGLDYPDAKDFSSDTGQGVTATVDGAEVRAGRPGWAAPGGPGGPGGGLGVLAGRREQLESRAQTVIGVARDRQGPRGTTQRKVPARSDRCGQYRCSGRSTGRDRCLALVPPGISRTNISAVIKLVTCRNSR